MAKLVLLASGVTRELVLGKGLVMGLVSGVANPVLPLASGITVLATLLVILLVMLQSLVLGKVLVLGKYKDLVKGKGTQEPTKFGGPEDFPTQSNVLGGNPCHWKLIA